MQNTLLMQYTTQCIKMFISNMPCTVIIHIYNLYHSKFYNNLNLQYEYYYIYIDTNVNTNM